MNDNLEERINKYISYAENGCWIWIGAKSGNNGVIRDLNRTVSVKRYFYKRAYPEKTSDGYFHLSCGDKRCVNPSHLLNRDDYFWTFVDKSHPNGCWNWTGALKGGYGYFSVNHKDVAVHRYAYSKYKGVIPKGKSVCHSCDNPSCLNPSHLWLGSQIDNMQDMLNKKRGNKASGENHHNAKITIQHAKQIKLLLSQNISMREIERQLSISYKTIQHIKHGSSWRDA